MDGVVVLEPGGDLLQDGDGVWPRVHTGIVALEGFDEGLADAIAFGAADRREAWNEVVRVASAVRLGPGVGEVADRALDHACPVRFDGRKGRSDHSRDREQAYQPWGFRDG
jgi:hypothetical protein